VSRATDLRYGRRGGGWVPHQPVKEHRRPDRYTEHGCANPACAGRLRYPFPKPTTTYTITCDGFFPHTFDVTPLNPTTAPTTSEDNR
jgi:hypothetical protein